jgi:flagellar basal body-associated protein FliL
MHHLLGVYKVKGFLLVSLLADASPASAGDSNSLKIAIISTLGLVLAAAITAIFATFRKDTSITIAPNPATTTDYIAELIRRATEAEHKSDVIQASLEAEQQTVRVRDMELDRLTRILLVARIDPATGGPLPIANAGG